MLSPAVEAAPALVGEHISPVSGVCAAPAAVGYIAPASAVYAALTPVVGPISLARARTCRCVHVACTCWVRTTCKIRVHELGEHQLLACQARRFEVQCSKDHVGSGSGFQLDHHGREVYGCWLSLSTTIVWVW